MANYKAVSSFRVADPGIKTLDGHLIRIFVAGHVYKLSKKAAKGLPFELLDSKEPPVEKATAAPGEKRDV